MWHILFSAENRRRVNTAMICRPSGHHQLSRVSQCLTRGLCKTIEAEMLPGGKGYKFIAENVALLLQAETRDVSPVT